MRAKFGTGAIPRSESLELKLALQDRLRAGDIPVPPYPAVAAALQRTVAGAHVALPEIAGIVGADASLAASVLRQANSASNAAPIRIVALEQAIFRLGTAEVVRIAFASSVGAAATAAGPLASLRRDVWRQSLLATMVCKELAPRRGVDPGQASLAGLLHDFGAVVVLSCLEEMAAVRPLPTLPEDTWQRLVADLHVEFGMVAAARWRLPDAVSEVIANHHYPQACLRAYRPLVQLVVAADQVNAILDRAPSAGVAALVDMPALDHDERDRVIALLPRIVEQMERFEPSTSRAAAVTRSVVAAPPPPEGAAAVDFPVETGGGVYRAVFVTPNAIGFRGTAPLQPNWLSSFVLRAPTGAIATLANVRTCESVDDGEYLITAQPFALDGPDKAAWHRLVTETRGPVAPGRGTLSMSTLPRR